MLYRPATPADAPLLAQLNHQLIADEHHRNPMTLPELQHRMLTWLSTNEYQAILFDHNSQPAGYALFRRQPDHIHLRHFFITRPLRRQGLGRAALTHLRQHIFPPATHLRLEVLTTNTPALAFWRSLGLQDYALTMECNIE